MAWTAISVSVHFGRLTLGTKVANVTRVNSIAMCSSLQHVLAALPRLSSVIR